MTTKNKKNTSRKESDEPQEDSDPKLSKSDKKNTKKPLQKLRKKDEKNLMTKDTNKKTSKVSKTKKEEEKPVVKKRPGRPPKQVEKKPTKKIGIVHEPSNKNVENKSKLHVLELVYDNPTMFKKIFGLFKTMEVKDVCTIFDKKSVKLLASDESGENKIYIKIFGEKLNRYYCKEKFMDGLHAETVQSVLSTLNNEHSQIAYVAEKGNRESILTILIKNDTLDEKNEYDLHLVEVEDNMDAYEELLSHEADYPIKFTLPSKHWKKKVSDFKTLSNIMTFRMEKNLLKLTYRMNYDHGRHATIFKNPAKINLVSNTKKNEIYSTSVYLKNLKAFASALVTTNIEIAIHEKKPIIFTANLDQEIGPDKKPIPGTEVCQIKVITNIIDLRDRK